MAGIAVGIWKDMVCCIKVVKLGGDAFKDLRLRGGYPGCRRCPGVGWVCGSSNRYVASELSFELDPRFYIAESRLLCLDRDIFLSKLLTLCYISHACPAQAEWAVLVGVVSHTCCTRHIQSTG